MTLVEQRANAARNAKLLKQWWQDGPTCAYRGRRVILINAANCRSGRTAYFAMYYPRKIGWKRINWLRFASVDLSQPSIFNERGKLRIRLLAEPRRVLR